MFMFKKLTHIVQNRGELREIGKIIVETLTAFNAPVKIVEAKEGLRQFHYSLELKNPVRMKAIGGLKDDLCYALGNKNIEIIAPIPDQKLIGVTVTKKTPPPDISPLDVYKTKEFTESSALTVPLGVDEFGDILYVDIAKMPHALIAGTTGSGKSVVLHTIMRGLLEKNSPDEVRLILVDPKRVELTLYNKLPHLLTPAITQAKKTVHALSWAVKEMERRFDILEAEGKQNIVSYHRDIYKPAQKEWKDTGSDRYTEMSLPEALPYIIIMIDELNDSIQAYPEEIEACILRLVQNSRAVGIHVMLATACPSVKVITGNMKANIPTRIGLMTASATDSRAILDVSGAEKLAGSGDMFYSAAGEAKPERAQAFFFSEEEVIDVVKKSIRKYFKVEPNTINFDGDRDSNEAMFNTLMGDGYGSDDELYEDAKNAVIEAGKASTSYIQRKLRVGYSRAARLMDLLEEGGVIGPAQGSAPREVVGSAESVECATCAAHSFCIEHDPLLEIQYGLARKAVIEKGKASTLFLQRQFNIGYARAATLMDLLEQNGVVGPVKGSKSRDVLIGDE